MPRLRGPLLSLSASGQLASQLIFRRAGRGHTAYPYFTPAQPQTKPQIAQRQIFKFLATEWPTLSQGDRDTWTELVPQTATSAYNAYLKINLERWQRFLAPSQAYPAAEQIAPGIVGLTFPISGIRYITWKIFRFAIGTRWGHVIYRDKTSGVLHAHDAATYVLNLPGTGYVYLRDWPLEPGVYWIRVSIFSPDGKWFHSASLVSGTAT